MGRWPQNSSAIWEGNDVTSKNHYVISGRSFIVLLIPFPVLKPFKTEVKCFSAFISCERGESTSPPGLLPAEENHGAGTETGSAKATLWSHWWVVLGTLSQWPQRICVGDQKPRLVRAEIISCFCDTSCCTWAFLSLCTFQWQNLLYSGNSQPVLWTSAPVCSALSWTECSVFAVSRQRV